MGAGPRPSPTDAALFVTPVRQESALMIHNDSATGIFKKDSFRPTGLFSPHRSNKVSGGEAMIDPNTQVTSTTAFVAAVNGESQRTMVVRSQSRRRPTWSECNHSERKSDPVQAMSAVPPGEPGFAFGPSPVSEATTPVRRGPTSPPRLSRLRNLDCFARANGRGHQQARYNWPGLGQHDCS